MNRKSRLALLAAALLSTTAMAAPRAVIEGAQTRTETVKYKFSEATTSEGAAALYARLQTAALSVCSDGAALDGTDAALEACVIEALASAVQIVAIPSVSALHRQAGRSAFAAR